ncbi:MAG: hypothetical protein AB7O37_17245 [Vicinamibacteria bacterium]
MPARFPALREITLHGAFAAACAGLTTLGVAQAQEVSIEHDEVRCVLADRFAVIEARLEPVTAVARARLLFRAAGSADWYYVEMSQAQEVFRGTLPRPLETTRRIDYYIEAVDRSLGQVRTEDYSAAVVKPGQCAPSLRVAAAAPSARIPLGSLTPGAPVLPPGFSAAGVVSIAGGVTATTGGAASSAVAGGGAGAGGLSTSTAALGIAGAAALAGGIIVASDSDAGSTPDVTGHWVGTYTFQTNILCDIDIDLVADLTQSGTSISGPGSFRTRTSARPDCGIQNLQITLSGSISGSSVMLTLAHTGCVSTMTGSVSGNAMGGSWRESGTGGCEGQTGIWTLARR